jgi:N-methylhydantoinase B
VNDLKVADGEQTTFMRVAQDPIAFEVIANAFTAIVDDMGAMIEKVSVSSITIHGRDYACCLADADGDVFSRGLGGIPWINGTAQARVKAVLSHIPEDDIRDGDVFLHNDPFIGGTHGPDVSVIMPVFADGERIAFAIAASHWPDVGGSVPGSLNASARSVHSETILIPPIHIIREGELDREVERLVLRNVRMPAIIQGDLRGMVEAARTGSAGLERLLARYGLKVLRTAMSDLMAFSEALLRKEIGQLPDGVYSFTDHMDRDPGAGHDDPVKVGLDVTISGETMQLDLSRSAGQTAGPVSCTSSGAIAAVGAAIKTIFPTVPYNDGIFRAVEVILPTGTVFSAEYPHPISGGGAAASEKIISLMHGCLIQVIPERCMASSTNIVNIILNGIDHRPGRGEEYVMYLWLQGGWGGRPGRRDAHTSLMPLAAGSTVQPAETLERIYPIRFSAWELKPDSEGAGKHRGGFAFHCPFVVTHGETTLDCLGDRQRISGWGAEGGERPPHGNMVVYAPGTGDERTIDIMSTDNLIAAETDVYYCQGGGGGWGDPLDRPAEWVLDDVRDGLVTPSRARATYGVVIVDDDKTGGRTGSAGEEFRLDDAATQLRRSKLRRERQSE